MTNTDIQAAYVGSSEAVRMYLGTDIVWEKQSPVPPDLPYSAQPFTIEVIDTSGGDEIKFMKLTPLSNQQSGATNAPDRKLYYTINIPFTPIEYWTSNSNPWKKNGQYDVHVLESNSTISGLSSGDTIRFYTFVGNGLDPNYPSFDGTQYCGAFGQSGQTESSPRTGTSCNSFGHSTASFAAYGNILSLITSGWVAPAEPEPGYQPVTRFDNLRWTYASEGYNMFLGLFSCCAVTNTNRSKLVSVENLVLPGDVTSGCYYKMFGKTEIIDTPVLPATVMKRQCYGQMFQQCQDLEQVPALPATTLAAGCYESMFYECRNLRTDEAHAPIFLPATSGVGGCYSRMFGGSSTNAPRNITEITCLLTNQVTGMTANWLSSSLTGTFYKSSGATWTSGASGIPTGMTIQDYVEPAAENTGQ